MLGRGWERKHYFFKCTSKLEPIQCVNDCTDCECSCIRHNILVFCYGESMQLLRSLTNFQFS